MKRILFIALISVIFTGCASTKNSYSSNSGGGQTNKNLVNFTSALKKAGGFTNQELTGAVPVTKKTAVFYNTKQIILTSKKVNNNKAGVVEDYALVIGGLDSIVIEPGTSFIAEKVTDSKVTLSCKVDDIVFSLSYADDGKVYLLESQQDEKHTAVVTDDEGKFRTVRYHYLLSGTREFMLKEGDGDVLQISQEFLDNNLHQVKGVINN